MLCFFTLYLREISKYIKAPAGGLYLEGLIHGGAYFRNFTVPCNIRHLPNNKFKKTLRKLLFDILNSEDDYIDTPTLIKKVKLAKNVEK